MLVRSVLVLVTLATFAFSTSAQKVYMPEKGSAERTAILNALRVPVERELRQKIVFDLNHFNVAGNWAFLGGKPQSANGGRPNYRGTRYQRAIDADMFDNNFFAILKRTGGNWRVIHYAIGCTDVCYASWWRTYRAPKSIFPYTE